ncbi:MAG: ATP-binding cassette domain-containing protein [Rhodospirillaceae bacterium]|jgi:phospholipid/cholesterol/gamma-HCH transport system ATP-binding protein|nr:ATP-binding cassette domain-containing protein [Rhodospirillaceae bacterium]MBT4042611.1 ATP-binding cassette domain-containing protein [Rhodospirillaceae bacterium]MBT4690010.1 ATP-binding cassette domain-containing protein [Rhodospirillaceae bacterium]MBT5081182.1 ATP-binding cassette domain-containing protein [Rhodospirillaceae bacterium]MBT5523510.1 ATP-binding cassette domain-containing protein [Rhodospirillaceae bacterium]
MNTPDTPKIVVEGLCKSFDGEAVLDGIDLSIPDGGSLVLLGESGSGKTLTLKCIMGLIRPDAGSIRIDGQETVGLTGRERDQMLGRCGMLFQQSALFDSLPVWRNVAFRQMQNKELNADQAHAMAVKRLGSVGLGPAVADLLPSELSGGMQKRVGIARAIASEPEIILLDEPTAGLDPIMSKVIGNLIIRNVRELGATALSITSDINTAIQIADQITLLHEGHVAWNGPPEEIAHTGNPIVERFIHKWKNEQAA